MRWPLRLLITVFLAMLPAFASAQTDLCVPPLPPVPNEAKAEQLRIDAAERAAREEARRAWEVKMFTVKNVIADASLKALCIFRVEVVNQSALRLVQVRAPKELLGAVEDAIKMLDAPPPPPPSIPLPKNAEVTGYVIFALDAPDPKRPPLPPPLQSLTNPLKEILPNATFSLADMFVARGRSGSTLSVNGKTTFRAMVTIYSRDVDPVITLGNGSVTIESFLPGEGTTVASLDTNVDVPVGKQVIVGKVTPKGPASVRAVVVVLTAKILD